MSSHGVKVLVKAVGFAIANFTQLNGPAWPILDFYFEKNLQLEFIVSENSHPL